MNVITEVSRLSVYSRNNINLKRNSFEYNFYLQTMMAYRINFLCRVVIVNLFLFSMMSILSNHTFGIHGKTKHVFVVILKLKIYKIRKLKFGEHVARCTLQRVICSLHFVGAQVRANAVCHPKICCNGI